METDEEILLQRLKNADTRSYAFHQLVHAYSPRLYPLIRRMLISHDDADDALQNVWIKSWNALGSFKAESSIFTWLYRIAVNECLTALAKKKRRNILSLSSVEKELAAKVDADQNMQADEIKARLQKAILKLPEKQRLVFNLRYFDEMPYEQMSAVLGTSVGALKASFHHAMKKVEGNLLLMD